MLLLRASVPQSAFGRRGIRSVSSPVTYSNELVHYLCMAAYIDVLRQSESKLSIALIFHYLCGRKLIKMKKNYIKSIGAVLLVLWTVLIIYGSFAPADELPAMHWWQRIPHFDKVVHFLFYLVETFLLLIVFDPRPWQGKWLIIVAVSGFSAFMELLQQAYFSRTGDITDFYANTIGVLIGALCYIIVKSIIKLYDK